MSGRDAILGKVRSALNAPAEDAVRRKAVSDRLRRAAPGIVPQRAQLPPNERLALFCGMAEKLFASVQRLRRYEDVPKAVSAYLRQRNLPASVRMGSDPRLAGLPWPSERVLEVKRGPSDGFDEVGLSHAECAVAETGTLVMVSGSDNPTTINFLPEHHIVVVEAASVDGDLETAIAKLRKRFGKGKLPRTVNLISGPSRSGDIEQKLVLGAHGPRALHILVVGG